MQIQDAIEQIYNLADEEGTPEEILQYINQATSRINIECNAKYPIVPNIDTGAATPFPMPDKWVLALYVPFGVARLKQKDSSQFEYNDLFREFEVNLVMFRSKYSIPVAWADEDSTDHVAFDPYKNPYNWSGW